MALSAKGFPIPVAKRCTKCRGMKAIGEFSKYRSKDDGHQYVCKACEREYQAAYREANADRKREYDAAYRAANADRIAEYHAAYDAAYRAANADRIAERNAAWRAANPDKARARHARRRARKRGARTEPYSRSAIFARWNNLCCYCDSPAEHLDHITALSRGGDDVESNTLPACAPCNLQKGAKLLWEWALTFAPEIKDN